MMNIKRLIQIGMFVCVSYFSGSFAQSAHLEATDNINTQPLDTTTKNVVLERVNKENKIFSSAFPIVFHKPTYLLPFYYTASPDNAVYRGHTPNNESLKSDEIKYQISFKVPAWKNILKSHISLYLAYTQMSYWQAYNKQAFFRETDYEPEIYLANEINSPLTKNWQFNFINVGVVHQSNGQGGTLERSWNRAYLALIASNGPFVIGFKPWIIFKDSTYARQNPNMGTYLGYEEVTLAYKYVNQVFSLQARNTLESGGRRAAATLSWSFPLTTYLKGYVQVFSGYGQSLIEYDHRTNSIGIGVALSDWV